MTFCQKENAFMKIPPIQTSRLTLRGFTPADARFAIGIWNDPEMGQYLPDPVMTDIDPAYLREIEALGEDPECCYLIAEDAAGTRVGTCSFIPAADGSSYDVAYCAHKDFWNRGLATETARGMVDYARSQGAAQVTVSVGQDNGPSNRVTEKLGFALDHESTYRKQGADKVMKDYHYMLKF